jgi:hypothetical protein
MVGAAGIEPKQQIPSHRRTWAWRSLPPNFVGQGANRGTSDVRTAGFEPAFTQRSSAHLHHRLTLYGGERSRSRTLLAERTRFARRSAPALALGEERDLFTTTKLASRTGERAKSETPRSFRLAARALLLSYGLKRGEPGGTCTHNPVVISEVSDLFTTDAATVLPGNR